MISILFAHLLWYFTWRNLFHLFLDIQTHKYQAN